MLKQIHPSDVYDFHITALDYVAKKVGSLVHQEKSTSKKFVKIRAQKKRYQALSFFRILVLLLGPVTGTDALRIKAHMEKAMENTGAPINANKCWEGYKIYERKLVMIASKDPAVANGSKKVVGMDKAAEKKRARRQQTAEEDLEETDEEEGNDADAPAAKENSARQPVLEDRGEEPMDIVPQQENAPQSTEPNASSSLSPVIPAKRPASIDDGPFEPMGDVDLNLSLDVDLDFDLDLEMPGTQEMQRARSVSIEPTAKKRKTVRRF